MGHRRVVFQQKQTYIQANQVFEFRASRRGLATGKLIKPAEDRSIKSGARSGVSLSIRRVGGERESVRGKGRVCGRSKRGGGVGKGSDWIGATYK